MKTISLNIYTIKELKEQYPEGYERAIQKHREDNEYWGLSDYMQEYCEELLTENGIKGKPTVFYSLSYCQGDGAMFTGQFEWGDYTVDITHSGHYYHYNSKNFTISNNTEDENKEPDDTTYELFNDIYVNICGELEKLGYAVIRDEDDEDNIVENCEINEWTFEEDGTMNNG